MSGRKLFILFASVFLCILFFSGCGGGDSDGGSGSGETGTVEGIVYDNNGNPVEGALCSITTDDSKDIYSAYTLSDGSYQIKGIPVGKWILIIKMANYLTKQISVTIVTNQTTTAPPVALTPAENGSLSGVVTVYGSSTPVAGAEIKVTTSDPIYTTQSDNEGEYYFESIIQGTHTITAKASGYQDFSSSVEIKSDTANVFDIAMQISSPSPTPSPGLGNVAGKVTDVSGNPVAEVQINLQKSSGTTTDSNGNYVMANLEPGIRTLTYAKSGYTTRTLDVTVTAGTTTTAPTVSLVSSGGNLVTTLVSKRINIPEVGDCYIPDVSNNGEKVVFCSDGNVISNWSNPNGLYQVYVWERQTGTITRVSNSANTGSTAGANSSCIQPRISGNGEFVVFETNSTDILPDGLAANSLEDVYVVRLSDRAIARITSDATDPTQPGNMVSITPDINGDGTAVVFASMATNLDNVAPLTNSFYAHIYYCKITNMVPGPRRMLDMRIIGGNPTEGTFGNDDPCSQSPAISYDGRYVAFSSLAENICANDPVSGAIHIFRCDVNGDPAVGWNMFITKHNGTEFDGASTSDFPAINSDGTVIAFETDAQVLTSGDTKNILLWKQGSEQMTLVSNQLTGTPQDFYTPQIDNSGRYVSFLSDFNHKSAKNKTRNQNISLPGMLYIKDMQSTDNEYTYGSVGASGQLPSEPCIAHAISPDGMYVVFETTAKNLTNDSYTEELSDIFIRKWK